MATKSPRQHHSQWPNVSASTQLPNASGATIQDSALEVGDICFSIAEGVLYVCTDATLGAAVWVDPGAASGGGGAPLTSVSLGGWYTYTQAATPLEEQLGNDSFDGALVGVLPIVFKASVTNSWQLTGIGETCRIRLYDMGPAAGPPAAPRLVSELTFTANGPASAEQALTVVTAAPGANQILNTDRMYEARIIHDSSTTGDVTFVGSVVLEIPSPSTVLETVKSELWAPPETPHAADDEFDSDTLDAAWSCHNLTDGVAGSFSVGTVDAYDTTFNSGNAVRVNPNPVTRRSWLLMQPPNLATKRFAIYKPHTFPTNLLVVARMRFSKRLGAIAEDGNVGIAFWTANGGVPEEASSFELYVNEPEANECEAEYRYYTAGGVASGITVTTNVSNEGQALEYLALHKIGTTYHAWVGTAGGNWIYMTAFTEAFAIDLVGIIVGNNEAASPGVKVHGIDFIRFYETANFLF